MRLYATRESVNGGEMTLLALVECLVMMGVSVYIAIGYGTLKHIAIGACLAPFLLLRTGEATRRAVVWWDSVGQSVTNLQNRNPTLWTVAGALWLIAGAPAARIAGIVVSALSHPVAALKAIPSNWFRQTLCVDLFYPPEPIPGSLDLKERPRSATYFDPLEYKRLLEQVRREKAHTDFAFMMLLAATWFVPAIIYRYSFKAVSLVYIPLLWTVHDSTVTAPTLRHKLEDIVVAPVEKLKRWYSAFVVVALNALPAILYVAARPWLQRVLASDVPPAIAPLVSAFVFTTPTGLDLAGWHVARGVNAFLTLGLFAYAEKRLRRVRVEDATAASSATKVTILLFIRSVLTWYVVACTAWIVVHAVQWADFLPIRVRLFP
jgi:hypothetical protein